jgi:hypothetical protein
VILDVTGAEALVVAAGSEGGAFSFPGAAGPGIRGVAVGLFSVNGMILI